MRIVPAIPRRVRLIAATANGALDAMASFQIDAGARE